MYEVQSTESRDTTYLVDGSIQTCSCPSSRWKGAVCKHINAVALLRGEQVPRHSFTEQDKKTLMIVATGDVLLSKSAYVNV